MTESAPILRTGRKFDQVVQGARQVFMSDGFEGASVDDIARAAGVSKATLYSYFPDKRLLFIEVATIECDRLAGQTLTLIDDDADPREALTIAAGQIVPFLLSDFAVKMFRISVAERDRFPQLGEGYYRSAPRNGHRRLAEYMTHAVQRGELRIDDLDMAADQFIELCKARLWLRAVLGIQTRFSAEEITHVVRNAVETFLARYGA